MMKRWLTLLFLIVFATACHTPSNSGLRRVNEYEAGKIKYKQESYGEAEENFDQWLVKYPQDAEAYVERGRAYNKLGKYSLALADFNKAIELASQPGSSVNPLRPGIYRCGILQSLGKKEEAKKMLGKMMKNPRFVHLGSYEKFLAYLLHGQFSLEAKNYEAALVAYNKALEIFERNTSAFTAEKTPYINRLALKGRATANYSLYNYRDAANDMEAYILATKAANEEITSEDYKSLALALYLAEDYERCKEILPKVSPEDRAELDEILGGGFFVKD